MPLQDVMIEFHPLDALDSDYLLVHINSTGETVLLVSVA